MVCGGMRAHTLTLLVIEEMFRAGALVYASLRGLWAECKYKVSN